MSDQKRVFFKSLGCPKNEVDGDVLLGKLEQAGVTRVGSPEAADYLMVNTCGFIQTAKEESIEEILKLAAEKNSNGRKQRLIVTGCLVQRYANELLEKIPEIDALLGLDQFDKIVTLLEHDSAYITRPPSTYVEAHGAQVMRDRSYAYLKISDGCNFRCSYCAIPLMRGNNRSRRLEAIESDVDRLIDHGVLELNLVAQDVAQYGSDIGKKPLDLLQMIEEKSAPFWLRPFYLHPLNVSDEILQFFADSEKFCNYIEIPIQHISTRILKKMNRGYGREYVEQMIERLREKLPRVVWRTTFIVGFPGETKEEYEELCDFVDEQKICRGGVFGYSHEDGTASYRLQNRLQRGTIQARQEELLRLINDNAEDFNRSLIGQTAEMIGESFDKENRTITGRLCCDAPEIDFTISVASPEFDRKRYYRIKVSDVTPEGFLGELI